MLATSDFARGENRLGFLIVRGNGSLVERPIADVYYTEREGGPVQRATATLVSLGVRAAESDEITKIYVASVRVSNTGKHWVVVQPRGARIQGFQILDVKERSASPAVGSKAPASDNPTLTSAPAKEITTANPPDVALLRYSIAESIRDGAPFVVVFATPQFCETRACGPAVEVTDAVRRRFEGRGIRFIHVEIYEDNNPGKGANRWVREWNLPSEPWAFVVDGKGVVRAKFEGAFSRSELEDAVRAHLLD